MTDHVRCAFETVGAAPGVSAHLVAAHHAGLTLYGYASQAMTALVGYVSVIWCMCALPTLIMLLLLSLQFQVGVGG